MWKSWYTAHAELVDSLTCRCAAGCGLSFQLWRKKSAPGTVLDQHAWPHLLSRQPGVDILETALCLSLPPSLFLYSPPTPLESTSQPRALSFRCPGITEILKDCSVLDSFSLFPSHKGETPSRLILLLYRRQTADTSGSTPCCSVAAASFGT